MGALVRAALLAAGIFVSSCARSQAPASAPGDDDLDALQHDLDVSESRLHTLLSQRSREAAEARAGAQGAEPEPSKPSAVAPAVASDEESAVTDPQSEAAASTSRGGGHCDLACRALASMRRSADGICSITGDADSRCRVGQDRVDAARAQLKRAGCTCP